MKRQLGQRLLSPFVPLISQTLSCFYDWQCLITHVAGPQGWERALKHLRDAAAAIAAIMPAAPQADPANQGTLMIVGGVAPGKLAGPNASTPVTIVSLETGELEVSLVAQAPSGAPFSIGISNKCMCLCTFLGGGLY